MDDFPLMTMSSRPSATTRWLFDSESPDCRPPPRVITCHWRQPKLASLCRMGIGVPAKFTTAWSALPPLRPSIETDRLPESLTFG